MRRGLIILGVVLLPLLSGAADSVRTLSKDEVISIVKQYHPVVKQAGLQVERAKAGIREARGAFDPVLKTDVSRKTFDGNLYYSYFNPRIQIPTWYGIELKAGVEEVVGNKVMSESTLGKSSYAGIKVPLTRGLLFDERRAVLKQARSMHDMSKAEQRLVVNNILFEAVSAYWNWVKEYMVYMLYADVVKINEARVELVKQEYLQGNRPAIDTTEAITQLQSYQLLHNEAKMQFLNAGLELSAYLWLDNEEPIDWYGDIVPDSGQLHHVPADEVPSVQSLVTAAMDSHPKIRSVGFKLEVLETERRLKAQSLMPKLDVDANLLSKGYGLPSELTTPFLENNYKLGVNFSVPLFMRKERGAYQSAKLKIQETNLELGYIELQVENKIKSYYNEVAILRNQVELYQGAYDNFQRMYRGELIRYDIGESTLFLVNSRENKLLQAQQKLLELKAKWHKSYAGLLWAAGII